MTELLYKPNHNALLLFDFTRKLIAGTVDREKVVAIQNQLAKCKAADFISAVDLLVKQHPPVSKSMKKGINKMLNVFYKHLNEFPSLDIPTDSFLFLLVKDNKAIVDQLNFFKPLIKEAQDVQVPSGELLQQLTNHLGKLTKVDLHYQVLENILFPFLEKQWPNHKCFQVLWSVHDDVRENLRQLYALLEPGCWDLKKFNRTVGDLFYSIRTIIFREEKIILPAIVEAGFGNLLDGHLSEAAEIGWSFITVPKIDNPKVGAINRKIGSEVNFATGTLTPKQIELIFNHLPVDITFVDENDTVRYFSTPAKRTFIRTTSVIGRKVQNCHPPESVWMVEEILKAFRKGEQDEASFWIPFKDQFVHIQYFALRNGDGNYLGTIEVTQDVKEIRGLKGERRLLNWENKL